MKCFACGYEKEKNCRDIEKPIFMCFVLTCMWEKSVNITVDNLFDMTSYACPKCGTLKIEVQ